MKNKNKTKIQIKMQNKNQTKNEHFLVFVFNFVFGFLFNFVCLFTFFVYNQTFVYLFFAFNCNFMFFSLFKFNSNFFSHYSFAKWKTFFRIIGNLQGAVHTLRNGKIVNGSGTALVGFYKDNPGTLSTECSFNQFWWFDES